MRRVLMVVSLLVVVSGCGASQQLQPPENVVLERADHAELYSLDPYPTDTHQPKKPGSEFHGYRILGRSTLSSDERARLIQATRDALDSGNGQAALCFNPHHGLTISAQGDSVDLVICFECQQMKLTHGGTEDTLLIGQEGEAEFDDALRRHGLVKAK